MHSSQNAHYGIERVQTVKRGLLCCFGVVGRHKVHASTASGAAADEWSRWCERAIQRPRAAAWQSGTIARPLADILRHRQNVVYNNTAIIPESRFRRLGPRNLALRPNWKTRPAINQFLYSDDSYMTIHDFRACNYVQRYFVTHTHTHTHTFAELISTMWLPITVSQHITYQFLSIFRFVFPIALLMLLLFTDKKYRQYLGSVYDCLIVTWIELISTAVSTLLTFSVRPASICALIFTSIKVVLCASVCSLVVCWLISRITQQVMEEFIIFLEEVKLGSLIMD